VVTFDDAAAWAARLDIAERDEWLQPEAVVKEVIGPLAAAATAGSGEAAVVADIGAGTGYFTVRLAAALPAATVLATDTEAGMREYLAERCRTAGLANVRVGPAGDSRMGLPRAAHVALMCTVYHHLPNRVPYLRASAGVDLVPGGYVVVIEHKTGDLPIPTPPPAMRFERSTIVAEFEEAGYAVVGAPAFLPYFNILVFRAPLPPALAVEL